MNIDLIITHIKLYLGEIDDDINFTYEADTQVYESCTASLDGEMFVLGGLNQRQVRGYQAIHRL